MNLPRLLAATALVPLAGAQDCTPLLTSSHAPEGDFGASLAAHGDLLVVGASAGDGMPSGAVVHPYGRAELFEYVPHPTQWRRLDVLGPSPSPLTVVNHEGFASSIAIGARTLFFAWPDDITGGNGSVRPFRRSTPAIGWIEEEPILPPFHSATGRFGISVAADGELVVVGERLSDGMAHVYARLSFTGAWGHLQTLVAPAPGSPTGTFGQSVAMQGEWIFVGDPGHPGALSGSGAMYVYRRTPAGTWQFTERLAAVHSTPLVSDGFGTSLDAEPGRLFVGADREASAAGTTAGAAHVFELTSAGAWSRVQTLRPPPTSNGQSFATTLDAFHDALLVGSPLDTTPNGSGLAYLYERDPVTNTWSLTDRYTVGPGTATGPGAGASVAVGDWHAALGAPGSERVRATPAYPDRNVDADNVRDACEALHDPTPCPALPNASGHVGRLHVDGTLDVSLASTELYADRLTTSSLGYFIVSRHFQVQLPGAGNPFGVVCLGDPIGRFVGNVLDSGAAGRVHMTVDPLQLPQPNGPVAALHGETWFLQYWHRDDPAISGRVTAFTEAARVTFE